MKTVTDRINNALREIGSDIVASTWATPGDKNTVGLGMACAALENHLHLRSSGLETQNPANYVGARLKRIEAKLAKRTGVKSLQFGIECERRRAEEALKRADYLTASVHFDSAETLERELARRLENPNRGQEVTLPFIRG